MNMQSSTVIAPPAPRRLEDMSLSTVMMRDIVLKTLFRKNTNKVTQLARAVCLPVPVCQEIIDMARAQGLMEAMGTLGAAGQVANEMPYQLTDSGKARALDALAQSEYFGPMPVPLEVYREQVERQSIRNIQITREQLTSAMGHLILPNDLISNLGPAVSSGRPRRSSFRRCRRKPRRRRPTTCAPSLRTSRAHWRRWPPLWARRACRSTGCASTITSRTGRPC